MDIWWYKKKHEVYRGEDCMKKFSESLREQVLKITNFEKKRQNQAINKRTVGIV